MCICIVLLERNKHSICILIKFHHFHNFTFPKGISSLHIFPKKKSILYYVNTTLYNTKPTIFKKLCSDNLVTLFEFEVILFFQISKVSAMLASQFVIWIEDLNRIIWIEWRISLITLKRVVKSLTGFVVLARGKLKGIQIERT